MEYYQLFRHFQSNDINDVLMYLLIVHMDILRGSDVTGDML